MGGSALAQVMACAGYRCLVLEATAELPDRTKGEWIAPWGVLDARRIGLEDELRRARGNLISHHVPYDEDKDPAEARAGAVRLDFCSRSRWASHATAPRPLSGTAFRRVGGWR